MRLIIYEPVGADTKAFIEFWSSRYTGYDDDFYEANVGQELTEAAYCNGLSGRTARPCPD